MKHKLAPATSLDATDSTRKANLNSNDSKSLDLAVVVAKIETYFSRYAYVEAGQALILALFAVNTWVINSFRTTPYLSVESRTKGSGKSTLLELLARVCREAIHVSSIRPAALYRYVEEAQPTLLIDEAEDIDKKSEIVEIANGGYKTGGFVIRQHPKTMETEKFKIYCSKVFAAIHGLSGTLADRCIPILMSRPPKGIVLKRIKEEAISAETKELTAALRTLSARTKSLTKLINDEPDEGYWPDITGRHAELFAPLLMLARLASPEIEERCHAEAIKLVSIRDRKDQEDNRNVLLTELVNLLSEYETRDVESFRPSLVLKELSQYEAWGAKLERHYGDKSRAMAVAHFLRQHQVTKTGHVRYGSLYSVKDALATLRPQIILSPAEEESEVTQ